MKKIETNYTIVFIPPIFYKILLMDSYGNSRAGSSKGHRSQRRMRSKGAKSRQQRKIEKKIIKNTRSKHEVTPEQVYWKKRHAKDISRERTYKQSLGIPQNDEQPVTDTNHDAATAFVAWENHITNLEKENAVIAWDAHIKFLYHQNNNHTNTIRITNRGEKRKFSEIC